MQVNIKELNTKDTERLIQWVTVNVSAKWEVC